MIGKVLRKIRMSRGLTQTGIAEALGLTQSAYSNYENDIRTCPVKVLVKFANYFNMSVDSIVKDYIPEHDETLEMALDKFSNDELLTLTNAYELQEKEINSANWYRIVNDVPDKVTSEGLNLIINFIDNIVNTPSLSREENVI